MSFRWLLLLPLLFSACTTLPPDPATRFLAPGEVIQLRVAAQLLHGHDMTEPEYGPQGYQPIPSYDGELVLTDSRLIFLARDDSGDAPAVSIPYSAVSRARPSRTALLNYIVVWDADNHPDSFLVSGQVVKELHEKFGAALMKDMLQRTGKPGTAPR